MQRRLFLTGVGVVTVLVIGGAVWRGYDEGIFRTGAEPPYEPWINWQQQDASDGPLVLVRAAILAGNARNAQPWLFKVNSTQVDLYADARRNMGTLDPYSRDMRIGLGCALENLMLAAAANGYSANLTLIPEKLELVTGDAGPQLVARVELTTGVKARQRPLPGNPAPPHQSRSIRSTEARITCSPRCTRAPRD